MSTSRLKDRVAWISGAASGMGAATARLMVAEGARVTLVDVDLPRVQQVAAELNTAGKTNALPVSCDVAC